MMFCTSSILCLVSDKVIGVSREKILDTFDQLDALNDIQSPKFVFAHIVSPHPPYLFDENGNPVPGKKRSMDESQWVYNEAFIKQLQYNNKRITTIVANLLNSSGDKKPVIFIQADHGSAYLFSSKKTNWIYPMKEMLVERFSILNALYLPEPAMISSIQLPL